MYAIRSYYAEGPLPQTRFVLEKAMQRDLKIAVVINKVDRPDRRIEEVKSEIEDLFIDLATLLHKDDFDLDIPILYASAKNGWALENLESPEQTGTDFRPILDFFARNNFV